MINITKPIVVVVGPTASGKSRLALDIAHQNPGSQIISVDAFQVYTGMDIGTGKIKHSEQEGIPHHLIDIKSWNEAYSVGEFLSLTHELLKIQTSSGPWILCGGTGFYLHAFLYRYEFNQDKKTPHIREKLEKELRQKGTSELWKNLYKIDPIFAQRIAPQDAKRIIRGLELYQSTQKKPSSLKLQSQTQRTDVQIIGLASQREDVYTRIHKRIESMFKLGWIEEVKELSAQGWNSSCPGYSAIGYPEIDRYLKGDISRTEMIECIQMNTRRFAKRQLTWLRRFSDVNWLSVPTDFTH